MRFLIGISALMIAGCSPQSAANEAADRTPASDHIAERSVPEEHRSIIEAFAIGDEPTADELYQAAQTLERYGATPFGQDNDLARIWKARAIALDADITDRYSPYRGRVKGPAYRINTLEAEASERFEEIFYAGEQATLTLNSDEQNVELTVSMPDENEPVCRIRAGAQSRACEWIPVFTSVFTISINNQSRDPARYILVSN